MATTLSGKKVGDIVKLKENGVDVNYVIVNKGRPSALYDDSCDGVWVVREQIYEKKAFGSNSNDCKNILSNLSTFYNRFDNNIKKGIKTVKIPYQNGTGNSGSVASGSSGLSCNVFLLSYYEVNPSEAIQPYPKDGAILSYFSSLSSSSANRIAYYDGTTTEWWTRTPRKDDSISVGYVDKIGSISSWSYSAKYGVRPALVLDSSLYVDSDGSVTTNNPPTITANKSGNLGALTNGFDVTYSVNDADGDSVTVTETLDSTQVRKYTATLGKQETYSLQGESWSKLTNGSHTFKISATDGTDTVEHSVTFTRNNRAPVITSNQSGDLGTLTDGFDVEYSVNDEDGDTVTVTEQFDSETVRSFEATPDQTETYSLRGNEWLKTANGEHTFKISASDGQQTAEHNITFTRDQTSLSVTLEEPFTADDNIVACQLKVDGDIPDDAVCKYEVTNNALDDVPVWEDCTEETKAGRGHVFKSKGSAFNFRVSIQRGNSGAGGYITEISGGYE